jgi:hypothetical protein
LSAYSPCAPPETSQLRQALITISLGAMSQGKWHCAERCLEASGETLLLMLLHALQHNRAALQQALKSSGDTSPMSTLAMLLLAADARIGLRQPLQKDWHMSRCASWSLPCAVPQKNKGVIFKLRKEPYMIFLCTLLRLKTFEIQIELQVACFSCGVLLFGTQNSLLKDVRAGRGTIAHEHCCSNTDTAAV